MLMCFVAIGVPNGKKATNTGLEQTAALGRHRTAAGHGAGCLTATVRRPVWSGTARKLHAVSSKYRPTDPVRRLHPEWLKTREDIAMRVLIILVAIIVVFALVGWISFNREPGRATVNIETEEIQEDTKDAMKAGANLLHKAGDDVDPDRTAAERAPATTPTR